MSQHCCQLTRSGRSCPDFTGGAPLISARSRGSQDNRTPWVFVTVDYFQASKDDADWDSLRPKRDYWLESSRFFSRPSVDWPALTV